MANFLISTMPAVGHVTPTLPLAAALVERGHAVWWHTGPRFASRVRAVGAHFVPMRHTPSFEDLSHQPGRTGPVLLTMNDEIRRLHVDRALGQLRDYRDILDTFPADVVVPDMCTMGAALLHETGGPPWASLGMVPLNFPSPDTPPWELGLSPATSALGRLRNRALHWLCDRVLLHGATTSFNRQRQEIGLPPLPESTVLADLLVSPFLHLQFCAAGFEYPRRNLPAHVHFVGPLLPPPPPGSSRPAWWKDLDGSRPVVHVTQGTVATRATQLILPTLQALADDEVLVVATSLDFGSSLGSVPANARVERFIPYSALLPHVDVMVTNGGYGGVNAALTHGVPLVVAGQSEDKRGVGARVAWAGVGRNLRTATPSPAQIADAVRTVLRDPEYRRNAERMQQEIARHGGPAEAARLLERLAVDRSVVT